MSNETVWIEEGRRVLVCGGRNYDNQELVNEVLDREIGQAEPDATVWPVLVHGDAPGADSLADNWAMGRDVLIESHPADWVVHGRAAGPIRNQEMIESGVDLVIAFPGGRGTADTVASCCGHGHRPGRITLADGREIVLPRDQSDVDAIEDLLPIDINGDDKRTAS